MKELTEWILKRIKDNHERQLKENVKQGKINSGSGVKPSKGNIIYKEAVK